jgi:hypothetical protein
MHYPPVDRALDEAGAALKQRKGNEDISMPNLCTAPRCICALALVVFALAALAGCNAPQASSSPPAQPKNDTAESIMQAYRQYGGEVVELGATAPSATVAVTDLTGTIPAYSLTQGNPPCAGYLQSLPSMIFTLAADEPAIEIALVGNTPTTLIVVAECADHADAQAGRAGPQSRPLWGLGRQSGHARSGQR